MQGVAFCPGLQTGVLRARTARSLCGPVCAMVKLHSAAADRNKGPILSELQRVLPEQGRLLEVASGSGQHIAHFAAALPQWTFVPTDVDETLCASVDEWVLEAGVRNVESAQLFDVRSWPWTMGVVDAIYNANMIHISAWDTTLALMRGAGSVLRDGGLLVMYGPYVVDGQSAQSNLSFSMSLRSRNKDWGVRELRDVQRVAREHALELQDVIEMPANNLIVIYRKQPQTGR